MGNSKWAMHLSNDLVSLFNAAALSVLLEIPDRHLPLKWDSAW